MAGTNDLQEIIAVFLERKLLELTDSQLCAALQTDEGDYSTEKLWRAVLLQSSSLVRIHENADRTFSVRVEPMISICEDFLAGKCTYKTTGCDRLHICHEFGHCSKPKCRSSHDLTRGKNRQIVRAARCQNIDQLLLVRLLQLKQNCPMMFRNVSNTVQRPAAPNSSLVEHQHKTRIFERRDLYETPTRTMIASSEDLPLLDVGFPSVINGRQIRIEDIEQFFESRNYPIREKWHLRKNQNFSRWTIRLADEEDTMHLLSRLVIFFDDYYLKFKRTKPELDLHSFVLQTKIDVQQGPIARESFSNYIERLVDGVWRKITDLSSSTEVILLIQCSNNIDFGRLHLMYQSRRQLQGMDVLLRRIHELDKVIVQSTRQPLSIALVQRIIEPVQQQIFTFTLESKQTAQIEFICADACEQWLQTRNRTEQEFEVTIKPWIEYVEDGGRSTPTESQPRAENRGHPPSATEIKLKPSWAMVANHPHFSIEYRNFIRSGLGCEVDISGDRVRPQGDPDDGASANIPHNSIALNDRTRQFMERFAFRSVSLNQPTEQLPILRAHSATVAFCHTNRQNYMLATRPVNIKDLMQRLFPKKPVNTNSQTTNLRSTVESLNEPDVVLIPLPARNWMSSSTKPSLPTVVDEVITRNETFALLSPSQLSLFANKAFETRLLTYLEKTYPVKVQMGSVPNQIAHRSVKFTGKKIPVDQTHQDLHDLLSHCCTKTYDVKTIHLSNFSMSDIVSLSSGDNRWIKISAAARIIEHHLNQANKVCVCEHQTSPLSIQLHYVDGHHSELGLDEQMIDLVSQQRLTFAECTLPASNRFANEWNAVMNNILKHADYGTDISLDSFRGTVSLYGLPALVKQFQRELGAINEKERLAAIADKVRDNVLVSKPEKANQPSVESRSEPMVPHADSMKIPKKYSILFDVDQPGFDVLVNQELSRLLAILKSNASLEKQIIDRPTPIVVPNATVNEFEKQPEAQTATSTTDTAESRTASKENWFLKLFQRSKPQSAPPKSEQFQQVKQAMQNAVSQSCMTIGPSKIIVCTGDLTTQQVDMIVICSTSKIMCDSIVTAAGPQVESLYRQHTSCGNDTWETDSGRLPCKTMVFLPWIANKHDPADVKQSIDRFVIAAVNFARSRRFSTLAIPSIGCGQLGFDPQIVAGHMLGETYRQLNNSQQPPLTVLFVLQASQSYVYDAFAQQLNNVSAMEKNKPKIIPFNRKTVRIKLTGPSKTDLRRFENEIKDLARSCSVHRQLTDQSDVADWSQPIIEKYYRFCLERDVIPTLDIPNSRLDLVGHKDAVSETEKYFLQMTVENLRHARSQAMSRGFVWSVQIASNKWEQYPFRINELIEQAQMKNAPLAEFSNENSERCRITFSSMEEHFQSRKRQVARKRLDSSLPSTWDLSGVNGKRVALAQSSSEYRDTLQQFDLTMRSHYQRIVRIERIQNERWYKQYVAHRDDFQQRYQQANEKRLFHGCASASAEKIIKECFNRTFAGLNGTLYGSGVYFHSQAKYSHNYAKANPTGERTMFFARVLVGKTHLGDPTTKVPSEGYDTTTDGADIFVVYHDAGAYAEYLITYI